MNPKDDSHPIKTYQIVTGSHGVAVFGTVPVRDLVFLAQEWDRNGLVRVDRVLGYYLRATLAVTRDAASAEAWLSDLGIRKDHPDWLFRGEIGISSLTIYSHFAKRPDVLMAGRRDAPFDAERFGRCRRLLAMRPDWEERLDEICISCTHFRNLIPLWSRLTWLYDEGDHAEVTSIIRNSR